MKIPRWPAPLGWVPKARGLLVSLCLALQLSLSLGGTGGLVLCTMPDGSAVIETVVAAAHCRLAADADGSSAPARCADVPILGPGPQLSGSSSPPPLDLAPNTAAIATSLSLAGHARPILPPRGCDPPPSSSLRILRSVVLLV